MLEKEGEQLTSVEMTVEVDDGYRAVGSID